MYQAAHLPSTVAEIYFNLPAVKACQFLPSFSPLSVSRTILSDPPSLSLSYPLFLLLSSPFFFTSSFPRFTSSSSFLFFFLPLPLRLPLRLPLPSSGTAATVLPRVFQHAPPAYRFPSADGGGQGWPPPPPCLAS